MTTFSREQFDHVHTVFAPSDEDLCRESVQEDRAFFIGFNGSNQYAGRLPKNFDRKAAEKKSIEISESCLLEERLAHRSRMSAGIAVAVIMFVLSLVLFIVCRSLACLPFMALAVWYCWRESLSTEFYTSDAKLFDESDKS